MLTCSLICELYIIKFQVEYNLVPVCHSLEGNLCLSVMTNTSLSCFIDIFHSPFLPGLLGDYSSHVSKCHKRQKFFPNKCEHRLIFMKKLFMSDVSLMVQHLP